MNPFDEHPPPYEFIEMENKLISSPPSYEAVMVEAKPLPHPHFFEEDLDKLKKQMTFHEAKQYEYYLELKKDIENIKKLYEDKIQTLENKILQLEKENKCCKKEVNIYEDTKNKIICIEKMVHYLDENYPLHSTTNPSEYQFGFIYVRGSTQSDVLKRGFNALVYHECGWISYRYPIPGTRFESELGDDPKIQYQGLLDITRSVVPIFEKLFGDSKFSKILTGKGVAGDFSKESFMKHTMFNAKTSISYYAGGKYPKDINDFSGDFRDESKVLNYIHTKITNLFEYYQECIKYKEPTFDFSTIV